MKAEELRREYFEETGCFTIGRSTKYSEWLEKKMGEYASQIRKEQDFNMAVAYDCGKSSQESKWVSVEIGLPEENIEVVAKIHGWDDMHSYSVLEIDEEEWINDEGEVVNGVTHWMPLPEPPKT